MQLINNTNVTTTVNQTFLLDERNYVPWHLTMP